MMSKTLAIDIQIPNLCKHSIRVFDLVSTYIFKAIEINKGVCLCLKCRRMLFTVLTLLNRS